LRKQKRRGPLNRKPILFVVTKCGNTFEKNTQVKHGWKQDKAISTWKPFFERYMPTSWHFIP